MQTIARSMADTGPIEGRYMPHAPPIVGRYGKRPHSRMRRLQLRTVHDLIGSPPAFAARAAPKERLVDSADVPAPRLTARGAQALLLVSRAVGVDRQPAALGFGSGDRLRRSRLRRRGGGPCGPMAPYARHGVNVNVDFYSGVVYHLLGIKRDLFVPIFAVGRVPGWVLQVLEQLENNILIRPLTLYSGPDARAYVPIEQRS